MLHNNSMIAQDLTVVYTKYIHAT